MYEADPITGMVSKQPRGMICTKVYIISEMGWMQKMQRVMGAGSEEWGGEVQSMFTLAQN